VFPGDGEEVEDEEENLSEDGRKMKKTLKDEEEQENLVTIRPLNLEFTVEQGDREEDEEPRRDEDEEEEKGDESDSSMASIFGEEEAESVKSDLVGTKRTFGQINGKDNIEAKKRQKFF